MTMISKKGVQTLARYNQWMNDKLYAAAGRLSDDERKEDCGAFFRSIHTTLNHLLWGDYTWIGRFTQGGALEKAYPKAAIGADLFDDWETLREARRQMDKDILVWSAALDENWLASDFSWYSGISRAMRTRPAGLLVMHLFNHQTHHRGQVTTLLSQRGIDPGDTDLMLMPD